MTTITINGTPYAVCEHLKELKEYLFNGELLNRWYNRSQFLKAVIGKGLDHESDYAGLLGSIGDDDSWYIEIYDLKQMLEDEFMDWENFEYELDDSFCPNSALLADKDGSVYLIKVDVD